MTDHSGIWEEPTEELNPTERRKEAKRQADEARRALANKRRAKRRAALDAWTWVANAGQFVCRDDGRPMGEKAWRTTHGHLDPEGNILTRLWRSQGLIRKFEDLVYLPAGAEFPDGERGLRYNIWRESGVEAKAGDVTWFEDHMAYLFPNKIERDYVLDFMALLLQQPGLKFHFALLIAGRVQGAGKSAVALLLRYIIGFNARTFRNTVKPTTDEVMDPRFSEWVEGAVLAVIEELRPAGKQDLASKLKQNIVDETLRVHKKFCPPYSIPNYLNFMTFTNHLDALRLDNSDRRWLVVNTDAEPKDAAYYKGLFGHIMSANGQSAVKHWLLKRETTLDPKARAPSTSAKLEMRELTTGDAEAKVTEALQEGRAPFDFDLVRLEDVVALMFHDKDRRDDKRALAHKWLLDVKAVRHAPYARTDLRRFRLWSVRNHTKWKAAGPRGRIEAWLAAQKRDMAERVAKAEVEDDAWLDGGEVPTE